MTSSVTPKAPLFQAFGKSDSCVETQRVVSVKMQDAEAVARMAATPGGRKAVQRARRRSRLPFETVGFKNTWRLPFLPQLLIANVRTRGHAALGRCRLLINSVGGSGEGPLKVSALPKPPVR